MRRNTRRRPTGARRATFAAVALMLGGGGLVAANVYASATEGGSGGDAAQASGTFGAGTIDCPDVGTQLTAVPDEARAEVDKELALLDEQIAAAYRQLQESAQAVQQDAAFADNAIMNPLKDKRAAVIERIAIAIDRVGDRPEGLEAFAPCTLQAADPQTGDGQTGDDQNGDEQNGDEGDGDDQQAGDGEQEPGNGGQAGNGPVAADFVDIKTVQPNVNSPSAQQNASRGTFTTSCGVNEGGLFNSDNVIVAPGVSNGAHHFHDYVGNQANNAFASDEDLANGDTSCEDQGDKSTYYWPVLRLQNGTQEQDAGAPGGGIEGNAGEIVTPKQVTLTFVGSPQSKVTAMPRLLRIITGDAKAFVNGTANANASWSCTGFEDRQLKDKYPLCPQGSDVVRTFKFQSCWDGRNIDSANHRTHVAFAAADGSCATGFQAIPQLVQRIVYDVDAPSLDDGGRTVPLFAVDSFPEQLHKPVTDHGDFINVFDEDLMREMTDCINSGRQCGAGADQGDDGGQGDGGQGDGGGQQDEPTENPAPPSDEPSEEPSASPTDDNAEEPPATPADPADPADEETTQPPADTPDTEPADDATSQPAATLSPKADTPTEAEAVGTAVSTPPAGSSGDDDGAAANETAGVPDPATTVAQTQPQGAQGNLADTGAQLWPAAVGAILLIGGFVVLRRAQRGSM